MDTVIDGPPGWPGVFRPLRHYVPDNAWRLLLGGEWFYFAQCGSPCWPPDRVSPYHLSWCPECWQARKRWHD